MQLAKNHSLHEAEQDAIEIRKSVLATMAEAHRRLAPSTCMALSRRSRICHSRVNNALKFLRRDGLAAYDSEGEERDWRLTDAGWSAIDQTPPLWMQEVA